jgi:hypothetical protein
MGHGYKALINNSYKNMGDSELMRNDTHIIIF